MTVIISGDNGVSDVDGSAGTPAIRGTDANTGIFFPAADTIAFSEGGAEAMRIDSSGNLLVGKTAADGAATTGVEVRADGTVRAARASTVGVFNRLSSDGNIVEFERAGTNVGSIESFAGTYIILRSGGDVLYIDDNVQAYTDNTWDMGGPSNRWDDVYATNGTIQTSDRNEKQDIEELSEAETRVAVAAKALMRKYRWKSAVAEKGDEARIHFGIIAQDLQAAFEAEGLDAGRYAMFIHSEWTDEETGEQRSRMGVRYNELLAFIIAAI